VQILVRFYSGETLVATEDSSTLLNRVFPGDPSPFSVFVSNPPIYDRYDLEVIWEDASEFVVYEPLTLLNVGVRDNFGIEVFGEVQNPTQQTIDLPQIAVTFYNAEGNIVFADEGFATKTELTPQELSTFEVSTFRDLTYESYQIHAQGSYFP
jgi:hypothetical protein